MKKKQQTIKANAIMKTIIGTTILLVMTVILASSCGPSLKVNSDYDRSVNFTEYKTFSMYNLATTHTVSRFNAERIINSIRTEMAGKGYIEDDTNPDLMVNAVSVLLNKNGIKANTNSYGYGSVYRPYAYWGAPVATSATFQTYNYKNGTLLIDVVDTKTTRMVWQGMGSAEIEKQPKNLDKTISRAVAKIMAGLPDNTNN